MTNKIKTTNYKSNSLALKKKFLTVLNTYVKKQNFPEKISRALIDENFINSNPVYYTYYPFLFNDVFGISDKNTLQTLTLAGFFYYKAILNIDAIFDNKNPENAFNKYVIANICQEESIKLLSSLFSNNHAFWDVWNTRKMEYLKAYDLDKNPEKITTYKEYEILADYKCAFGKIAIDSLFFLSKKKDKKLYKNILESHKYFYVGFQIIDDITDFVEDIENEQFNILYFELKKSKDKKYIKDKTVKELKTQLYLDGTITKMQKMASYYLEKGLSFVSDLSLDQWKEEMQKLYNTAISQQLNTRGYVRVFKDRKKLSDTIIENNNVNRGIDKAISFITKEQQENGNWNDYFNEAGVSNTWVTAFILSYFPENIYAEQPFIVNNAISFLKKNSSKNKLWGYNSSWISDADSTTFTMLAFQKFNTVVDSETIVNWLEYQKSDGGFSTYKDKETVKISLNSDLITDVDGWTQSHFCVSTTAYYLLSQLNTENDSFKKLRTYLIKTLKKESKHYSYWWTDFIYSLTFLIKGAELNDDVEMLTICNKLMAKYIETSKNRNSNNFYQALLLDCICSSTYLFEKYENEITKIATQLVNNQFADGSWEENYSLRIPNPSIKNPESKNINWIKADKGTNIIIRDYHRLFSTIVSLSGLSKYVKNKSHSLKNQLVDVK